MKSRIIMLLMLLAAVAVGHAENNIQVADISIAQGGTATIKVDLSNDIDIKGFQMDLTLPEGVTYVSNAKGSRLATDYDITTGSVGGAQRFFATSSGNTAVASGSGTILEITVKADKSLAETSSLKGSLSNITLASPSGQVEISTVNFNISIAQPSCTVTVADVNVEKGGTATIQVSLDNDIELTSFMFDLTLPEGFSLPEDFTAASCEKGERAASHSVSYSNNKFLVASLSNAAFSGTSGTVLSIPVVASPSLEIGVEKEASVSNIQLVAPDESKFSPAAVNFKLTVVAPTYLELKDTDTEAPSAASNVNVHVIRTLKAGVWNTICLPFAMTEAQVKTAFGEAVELADFDGCVIEENGNDVVGITVKFTPVADKAIAANHPYIIKIGGESNITSFTAEGVDVSPEEEPLIQKDPEGSGRSATYTNFFVGSYKADKLKSGYLFLNDNKFYYSKGSTQMKAFRGYFDFKERLTSAENDLSGNARLCIIANDESTTGIDTAEQAKNDGKYYTLQGVAVEQPGKGVYVKDGKKVIIK